MLEKINNLEIISSHKADENYSTVAIASIIAKIIRDREISNISEFYGEQYINQLFNMENPLIIDPQKMLDKVSDLSKPEFVGFIKKLLIFANVKIAYQGKRHVKRLKDEILKIIE